MMPEPSTSSPQQQQQHGQGQGRSQQQQPVLRPPTLVVGLSIPPSKDAAQLLQVAREDGYDYVTTLLPVPATSAAASGAAAAMSHIHSLAASPSTAAAATAAATSTAAAAIAAAGGINTLMPTIPSPLSLRTDITSLESRWWRSSIVGMTDAAIQAASHIAAASTTSGLSIQQLQQQLSSSSSSSSPITSPTTTNTLLLAQRWLDGLEFAIGWASHMHIPAVILPPLPTVSSLMSSSRSTSSTSQHQLQLLQHALLVQIAPALQQLCVLAQQQQQQPTQIWIMTKCEAYDLQMIDRLYRLCDAPSNLGIILWMTRVPTTHHAIGSTTGYVHPTTTTTTTTTNPAFGILLSSSSSTSLQAPSPTAYVANQLILLHRAMALHLKAICFPTSVFLTNKRGYPTLAKAHQVLFTELLRRLGRTVRVLVHGPSCHPITATPAPSSSNSGIPSSSSSNSGQPPPQQLSGASQCLPYLQYIRHMRSRPEVTLVLDTEEAQLEEGYLDQLQRPLQPLGNHLDFGTYETFERDPIKYMQYQKAILYSLRDGWMSLVEKGPTIVTIVVAGAGRGPLVTCALRAWHELPTLPEFAIRTGSSSGGTTSTIPPPQLTLRIFAVEKNPHAVLFLQSMKLVDPMWQDHVVVVPKDMRYVKCKEDLEGMRADIVVSELLGSFGDNELSPECLKGLSTTHTPMSGAGGGGGAGGGMSILSPSAEAKTSVLKKTTVFIPLSYTSHLAPVSSYRLWTEARSVAQHHPTAYSGGGTGGTGANVHAMPVDPVTSALETPYVTRTHAASQTHPEQDVWTFCHPHDHAAPTLDRYAKVTFGPNITHGTGYGSGYGPVDAGVMKMAHAIVTNPNIKTNTNTTSTTTTTTTTTMDQQQQQQEQEQQQQQQLDALEEVEQWQGVGSNATTIHGFLGTFTAILYQSPSSSTSSSSSTTTTTTTSTPQHLVEISTRPSKFSVGMYSWFPLWFPLHQPLYIPSGATCEVHLWRKTRDDKVWYEWCAQVIMMVMAGNTSGGKQQQQSSSPPQQQPQVLAVTSIHNPNGRSSFVSM